MGTPIPKAASRVLAALLFFLAGFASHGQHIMVHISVKHILNAAGSPPSSGGTNHWLNADYWRTAINAFNAGCDRFGRGFRFREPVFEGGVSDATQYFDIDDTETVPFEYDVRTHPQQYKFRSDALNVYVVNGNLGPASAIECRGWASSPLDPLSKTPPTNSFNGRIAALCISTGPLSVIPHEFGHHFSLIHSWGYDARITDIPLDADPGLCNNACACMFSNTVALAASQGWSMATLQLMTNNLMSYHCDINDDFDLSERQLDAWADAARRYLASEMTGVTYFVDQTNPQPVNDGYSTNPYRTVQAAVNTAVTTATNIVMLRPGSYNEQLTISQPVVLRVTRAGWATIGQ